MIALLLPSILLFIFSLFNLLGIKQNLFINELTFFGFAVIAFIIVKKIGRPFFNLNAYFIYWFFIFLLVFTYIIGFEAKGSKRWIDLYFFNFQPSEFFKVFFAFFMAHILAKRSSYINELGVFLISLIYFIIPTFVIFMQPDLGNAMVYVVIYISILLFAYIPKKYLVYMLLCFIIMLPPGWLVLKDYQKARITSFLNPHDISGDSYNMIQAVITSGSGQFTGKGLGLGTQSRLYFLPENHTDFAFSSLVEQFGFVGGITVIILFFFIITAMIRKLVGLYKKTDAESREGFLYTIGFMSYILFQIIINIGMNLGMVPVAGIALPFISYGGSALIAVMVGLALLP